MADRGVALPPVLDDRRPLIVKARVIRTWRADLDCTWRRIAELEKVVWESDGKPTQQRGQQLCAWAAEQLGENPAEAPWN